MLSERMRSLKVQTYSFGSRLCRTVAETTFFCLTFAWCAVTLFAGRQLITDTSNGECKREHTHAGEMMDGCHSMQMHCMSLTMRLSVLNSQAVSWQNIRRPRLSRPPRM